MHANTTEKLKQIVVGGHHDDEKLCQHMAGSSEQLKQVSPTAIS